MKITRITLWKRPLTSHATYYMANGKTCDSIDTVVIRLDTDLGITGWGESCPIPHYLPAYADGIAPAVAEMVRLLIGVDPLGVEALMHRLDRHLPGHEYAKSAIDIALWDLTARYCKVPLYVLLGGRQTDSLPLYHSITCIEPQEMACIARDALARGMNQFQVKLGADADWQADVARLSLVREAVGSGPIVYGDWNCGSKTLEAIRVGRAVAHLDVMLEQPCATLEECAAVRSATGLPMKIDENANDLATLRKANELGCMDVVALKLSKFGGLSVLRRARDFCLHMGTKMCIEDTWGSDIATAAALHLASATPPEAVQNVCDLSHYVTPRLDPDGPSREKGRIKVPDGIGIGVAPDLDTLGDPLTTHE